MTHIDLHVHSVYSHDGEVPPRTLLELAKGAGIGHLAITDHNRVDALDEALAAAPEYGVAVHPAVEIDCSYQDANVHLLGYFIDHRDAGYKELWEQVRAGKAKTNDRKVGMIQALGFHVAPDALAAKTRDGVLSSTAIAQAVLDDPRNRGNPELRPYRDGGAMARDPVIHFSWKYMGKGGAAYVPNDCPTLAGAVRLIAGSGGAPVLAHPGPSLRGMEEYLPGILGCGVRAVEAYCNYHDAEQARFWRAAAEANRVPVTCGSDYHGSVKPSIAVGSHGANGMEARILDAFLALERGR